jgi:mono/diheme cytochrome c family protein
MDSKLLRLRPFGRAIAVASLALMGVEAAHAGFDPGLAFMSRCSGCHSVGKGDVVGPDLKGVTSRHDRNWLHLFIHSSQSVIQAGDASAMALFEKYKHQKMPDHPLSVAEIDQVLAFIEKGGPDAGKPAIRHARTATVAETERGRQLFLGIRRLANAGAACIQCHAVEDVGLAGGTLACDLTRSYIKYQDWGMTRAIQGAELPLMASIYRDRPVTEDEAFALKAFLYRSARSPIHPPRTGALRMLTLLGFSGLAIGAALSRRGTRSGR